MKDEYDPVGEALRGLVLGVLLGLAVVFGGGVVLGASVVGILP